MVKTGLAIAKTTSGYPSLQSDVVLDIAVLKGSWEK